MTAVPTSDASLSLPVGGPVVGRIFAGTFEGQQSAVKSFVATRGIEGCLVYSRSGRFQVIAWPFKPADPSGTPVVRAPAFDPRD